MQRYADTSRGRPFSKDPAVVWFRDRYLMYYSMPPHGDGREGDGWAIGIAESRDLARWQRCGEMLPAQAPERKGLCAPGAMRRVHTKPPAKRRNWLRFSAAWPAYLNFRGLLLIAEHEWEIETAARYGKEMLDYWERIEEQHYVVSSLRTAATFSTGQKAQTDVNACAEALSQIASTTGAPDALDSLAYTLGESSLSNEDMQ